MSGTITAREFDLIRDFIQKESAISLAEDKVYPVEARLGEIMKRENISDYHALHRSLQDPRQRVLRDTTPFEVFRDHLLPAFAAEIREGKRDKIRIWSAASPTGQEAYFLGDDFSESGPYPCCPEDGTTGHSGD